MITLRAATPSAFLALGVVGAFTQPALAADMADDAAAQDAVRRTDDPSIIVTGERWELERESPRATAPLIDTPQTVTVISDQTLRKQNLLTLRDALTIIPGITFGAGEGGGGYGDSINLRGFSANNDITLDGVRDSAQYSRTDPFNLQQIEVYNGANSVFNGSGSVGGTINLVSKLPQPDDLTILQAGIGTDDYYRGTIDSNHRLGEFVAVRLNAMVHRNDVPGRDVERYQRWGVAPSITLGIGSPTSLTLAYVHQRDDNTPIYGVPFFRGPVNAGPLPDVHDSDYFGIVNLDEQETVVDRLTMIARHDFSDDISIRNLTRWQRVGQFSQTSAPQGTFCLASTGLQPIGANANATAGLPCVASLTNVVDADGVFRTSANPLLVAVPSGFYQPSGPRGLVRDQENQLLHNQTDLRIVSGEAGGVRNTLVVGGSASWEDYGIVTASLARDALGQAVVLPLIDLSQPDTFYAGPINFTVTAASRGTTTNRAVYAFDTIEIGPMLELNAGVRYEWNRAEFVALGIGAPPPGTAPLTQAQITPQVSDDELFSYRLGAVFKPAEQVSIYLAYANSRTPTSATVRLGCGVVSGAVDPCAAAPETAVNYEAGIKANVLDERLQLTAAVFRNSRTNFRVPSNDPVLSALPVLDGRARVDGVVLGAAGNITPAWTVFANYAFLDSEVRQSVSDFCLANPGSTGCANSAAVPDPQAGQEVLQTPRHAASLFTTYRLPFGLELGYGFTYQGSFALNNQVLVNGVLTPQFRSDDFLIHRAYVGYTFGNGFTAQLNVSNFTGEGYYTNIRNNVSTTTGAITGGWATPGEDIAAVLSLFYSF